ncbi:hypothetical protein BKI52_26065 [marine bacterium AO1-C]|nr:hypothetical protein BKI52_26065 [marine bacterium AO1-C]
MKPRNLKTLSRHLQYTLLILLLAGWGVNAQKVIDVPLSKPGKPGKLKMGITYGSIKVVGYDGKVVQVSSDASPRSRGGSSGGMRRIPNTSMRMTITEENNYVKISTSSHKRAKYIVKVPRKFDIKISTVNSGTLEIENIEGEIEASNVNGSIYGKGISGSVLANTVNGRIVLKFAKVKSNTPMSFRGFNGKIDVTLPKRTKANLKIRSDQGQIYSDFDMEIDDKPVVEESKGNRRRIVVDKWVMAKINGGGPTLTFKNYNGNVYIRRGE